MKIRIGTKIELLDGSSAYDLVYITDLQDDVVITENDYGRLYKVWAIDQEDSGRLVSRYFRLMPPYAD